ncbi:MAG: putative ATPase/transcriptional regulator with XRE-family HTH domain [Phenylobacterium sp.]|jgi:predicted ATPase/transcriptional regulator with XRE-family HTH domain
MSNVNQNQAMHSGKRLRKLRELQGLTVVELAQVLKIDSMQLQSWEAQGVPDDKIADCCEYFDVPGSLFSESLGNQTQLNEWVESHLFAQTNDTLEQRIKDNRDSKGAHLDLSSLGLNHIPSEVYGLPWLRHLDLSNNLIKHLPPSVFLQLSQIDSINLDNNLLQYLPAILLYTGLKALQFNDNPLNVGSQSLGSIRDLNLFSDYISSSQVVIAIVEDGVSFGHSRIDGLSFSIEKNQPLLLTMITQASEMLTLYKDQLDCIIYMSPKTPSKQVEQKLALILEGTDTPVILLADIAQYREQYQAMRWRLLAKLPQLSGLIFQADEQAQLTDLYIDLQQRDVAPAKMKVIFKQLTLTNIGVYEQLEIDFNAELTVLIGLNGAGKSTILKALALATLGQAHSDNDDAVAADLLRITGNQGGNTRWQPLGKIMLTAIVNGQSVSNTIELNYDAGSNQVKIKGQRFAELFNDNDKDSLVQLMLGIGEQRSTKQKAPFRRVRNEILTPKARDLLSLIDGDEQACIAGFSQWLGNLAFDVSQGDSVKQALIDSCFAVFSALMQEPVRYAGITGVEPLELWVEHQNPQQRIPLRLASQGYQAVMGWIGYILQRMFEAYPNALQPLQQPAIILIDEIDQLLHIKWQQKILEVLAKQFFPQTQWIITTHSPMVLNGLEQDQVRQLHERGGKLVADPSPTELW